jgi:hypothetical protein
MANSFTRSDVIRFAGSAGKSRLLVTGSLVIDTPAGSAADEIPASLFGVSKVIACLGIVGSAETSVYSASADATGDSILVQKSSTLVASSGTLQVETATVVAEAGATSSGNLSITVTSALFSAAQTVTAALVTETDTTASLIATKVRTALSANAIVAANFTVGGSAADVVLTAKVPAANDETLNVGIAAGLGVTAVASSVDTTAGVAQVSSSVNSTTDLAAGTYVITLIGK